MALTITKRNYLSLTEAQAAVPSATLDRLDRAEQYIDDYVGYQEKHVQIDFRGIASSATDKTLVDTNPASQLHIIDGYFANCVVEIIGGTGKGQVRFITDSSFNDRSVTVEDAWDTPLDTTSFYRIYQLAKFPRAQDVYSRQDGRRYYKSVPDALKQAIIAELEFMQAQGDAFFQSNDSNIQSESIGNYSYSRGSQSQQSSLSALVAPRARALLSPLKNSGGQMVEENPTCL